MPARVLVFQSCKPVHPEWIDRCMETVRAWARLKGYDYRLLGEELFLGIPDPVVLKVSSKLPLTDIGRLLWVRRLLAEGAHETVIWIDSDVLIFAPEQFSIEVSKPALVCREISVLTRDGGTVVEKSVNPTVLSFRQGNTLLPYWIRACEGVAQRPGRLENEAFGRPLLEAIGKKERLQTIEGVAHNTLDITADIVKGQRQNIRRLVRETKIPFAAANLGGHFPLEQRLFDEVVERLLADGFDILAGKPVREPG